MDRYLRHMVFIINLLLPHLHDKIVSVVATHKDSAVYVCVYVLCVIIDTVMYIIYDVIV